MKASGMWGVLTRKKKYGASIKESTQLARVLTTFDLTALGIGSTLGVGIYIIAGQVARETAGPAVVVSFLIAAIASVLSGLCYAEFGARIPRAGSAYVYSYVTIGELVAFIIGWNLILEYVIGAASVAKGISLFIDSLADNILKNTFKDVAPINVNFMAEYFDFFVFGLAMLLSVGLAFGLKESTMLNNLATVLNVCVVLFIIIAGAIKSDVENWSIPANEKAPEIGNGGFLPFGVTGMLKGAATCFYAFVGFDCIATTAEEVKNPKRAIPFAIVGSQIVIFIGYFCASTVLTLMVPFYKLDVNAPFPHAFSYVGLENIKWVVTIGGICGLFTSLFGCLLPLPRILYALASDGLIFKFLGKINTTFSTPMVGTLIAGLITGLMGALFNLSQLVNMMSIGTLLAYTMVSTCVLILRYRDAYFYDDEETSKASKVDNGHTLGEKISNGFGRVFNTQKYKEPTSQSQKISLTYILIYSILALIMGLLLFLLYHHLADGKIYMIVLVSVVGGGMIISLILLSLQPTSKESLSFRVPFVPLLPALSMLINIYLMLMLDAQTWIRFGIWMFIGIPIYIFCVRNSCKPTTNNNMIKTTVPTTNGYTNSGFIDEDSSCPSEEKPPSEDSGIERSMENIRSLDVFKEEEKEDVGVNEERLVTSRRSINSIEDALATLDDAIQQEDDGNIIDRDFERKLSVGNFSNASSAGLIKEDVVALVHREDVKSIPTTPIIEVPSAPILTDEEENSSQSPLPSLRLNEDFDGEDETDTDVIETETSLIPPAPPLIDFEVHLIPRVSIHKEDPPDYDLPEETNIPPPPSLENFQTYKPPSIPRVKTAAPPTPAVDYPTETSKENDEEDETLDDNVKFGDKHHQKIKDKLTKMLMNNVAMRVPQTKLTKPKDYKVEDEPISGSNTLKPVMSKIISEINKNVGDSENDEKPSETKKQEEKLVDETPQTPGDIKNRLDALFRSTRVNPMNASPKKPRIILNNDSGSQSGDNKDMENHKLNMLGTLNSIKLRNMENKT